jgi:hypothetical protein
VLSLCRESRNGTITLLLAMLLLTDWPSQVLQWVMSYDGVHDPLPLAITAASAALLVSGWYLAPEFGSSCFGFGSSCQFMGLIMFWLGSS